MTNQLEVLRHSAAHLMAAAVQKLYPDAKFGVGPALADSFYYDIELKEALALEDLKRIEQEMQKLQKEKLPFERQEMSIDEAIALFSKLGQTYKVELLHDLKNHGTTVASEIYGNTEESNVTGQLSPVPRVSIYRTGDFVDLCRGPHVADTGEIKAFKLTKLAGAYWRGKEGNPMLQRVYGTAFDDKKALAAYLTMLEESKKRDHKILGPQLDLFVFSDLVGPGLPLWTPKGTELRNVLDNFVWQLREARGYTRVEIPHITKKELYETSGHWDKFKDELFRITTREGHEFAMKPMNCPHHTQIYARRPFSYRELPQRYANTTMCYRDEQTGELSGLSRVRAFAQDDAHVFCRLSQVKEEFLKVWDIVHEFYQAFGFDLVVRLSTHDPKHPEKYLGNADSWKKSEAILKEVVSDKKVEWIPGIGEAAFYGPKLDFIAKDAIGRDWQVATIQLDMNMPERFDLSCINEQGEKERIVMIHCAIMGSIERFLSVLIEHYAGAFPAWLAPVQVALLPVSTEKHSAFVNTLATRLKEAGVRTGIDDSDETIGKKVRRAEQEKIPYILVIGDREAGSDQLAVRERGSADTVPMSFAELVAKTRRS